MSEITILNCDCADLDVDLVSTFDTMIVDPPYREHVHKSAVSQSPKGGVRARGLGFGHLSEELREVIATYAGLVKRWSVIYSDAESLHPWKEACERAGAKYIRPVPWIRWSMPQLSGDRPTTGWELLTCYWGSQKGRKAWNGPGNLIKYGHEDADDFDVPLDSLEHKCLRGADKHRTEKPLDQALDLVEFFSDPGDIVFDPTCGSGTTALACAILDRDFVGCELDEKWCAFANERVRLWQEDQKLSERDAERFGRFVDAKKKREQAA
jgi:hypothetical protein